MPRLDKNSLREKGTDAGREERREWMKQEAKDGWRRSVRRGRFERRNVRKLSPIHRAASVPRPLGLRRHWVRSSCFCYAHVRRCYGESRGALLIPTLAQWGMDSTGWRRKQRPPPPQRRQQQDLRQWLRVRSPPLVPAQRVDSVEAAVATGVTLPMRVPPLLTAAAVVAAHSNAAHRSRHSARPDR